MEKHLSHILNHLGEDRSQYYNAVSPPIIQTSNFAFGSFQAFKAAIADEIGSHIYTRGNNPTVEILRKKIAALEKTEDSLAFASGSGAVASAVLTFLESGDHVICVESPYSWTKALMNNVLPKFGIQVEYVDGKKIGEIEKAIRENTKMLYLESPNSATFDLQDLSACAALCREKQIISLIDNSYSSPIFQNPAEFGIDLIIHSGTKYLNGHSDVVCGFVCGKHEHIAKLFHFATMTLGNILGTAEAALVLRGLRTLELRMTRSNDSTKKIVAYLKSHREVEKVIYPWDVDFPQSELVKKQMTGSGGLFSILLETRDRKVIEKFCQSLQTFLFAVSWGGHESLILPYCSLMDVREHPEPSVPVNLIRFYIGLEDPEYLIQDLSQAFDRMR